MSQIANGRRTAPRRVSTAIVLALLVGVLAGCDDSDDGSGGSVSLYFSTSNIQECMPMDVDVDLAAAGAVVAVRNDGLPDCNVAASLAGAGCTGTFELLDAGSTLAVTIDGCEVPPESSLFDCEFSSGDPAVLNDSIESSCDCVGEPVCDLNIYCLRTPEICVSEAAGPSACEDCFNSADDDGDGFVDCDDANCYIVDCGVGQTTITCTSTSTTTTTTL